MATDESKTKYAAPALWGISRREGIFDRGSPNIHNNETTIECKGTPTEDWLRRQAIATVKSQKMKYNQQKPYPEWIKESDDNYMTTKRPLPQSNHETVNAFDKDHQCDPWGKPYPYDQSPPTFIEQPSPPPPVANTDAHNEQPPPQPRKVDENGSTSAYTFQDDFPVSIQSKNTKQ